MGLTDLLLEFLMLAAAITWRRAAWSKIRPRVGVQVSRLPPVLPAGHGT
jgi:hypothetical protein